MVVDSLANGNLLFDEAVVIVLVKDEIERVQGGNDSKKPLSVRQMALVDASSLHRVGILAQPFYFDDEILDRRGGEGKPVSSSRSTSEPKSLSF